MDLRRHEPSERNHARRTLDAPDHRGARRQVPHRRGRRRPPRRCCCTAFLSSGGRGVISCPHWLTPATAPWPWTSAASAAATTPRAATTFHPWPETSPQSSPRSALATPSWWGTTGVVWSAGRWRRTSPKRFDGLPPSLHLIPFAFARPCCDDPTSRASSGPCRRPGCQNAPGAAPARAASTQCCTSGRPLGGQTFRRR